MDAVRRRGSWERMNYIKRFGCLLLTFALCFTLTQPPRAKASVIAGTAVTAGLISQLLVGAGITLQSAELVNKVVEDFMAANPEVRDMLLERTAVVQDALTGSYHAVLDFSDELWQTVCNWVDSCFDIGTNEYELSNSLEMVPFHHIIIAAPATFTFYYPNGKFDYFKTYLNSHGLCLDWKLANGSVGSLICDANRNVTRYETKDYGLVGGSPTSVAFYYNMTNFGSSTDLYGPWVSTGGYPSYVEKPVSVTGAVTGEEHYIDEYGRAWDNAQNKSVSVPIYPNASSDGILVGTDYYDAYLPETYGWLSGEAYVDAQGRAREATQPKTYKDVAAKGKVTEIPAVDEGYEVGDATIGDIQAATQDLSLQALFITKFPFSIPWDVFAAIKLLAAPPKVPHWEVDFLAPIAYRVGGWEGDTTVVIDFSEFELLGQLSRWGTTIMFIAALAMGTKKLMWTA